MEGTMGEIRIFAGTFAPLGWMFCQGQPISIAEYTAMYALIGTTYGGDGQTTFKLPDLRSRIAVGAGRGPGLSSYYLGQAAGTEAVPLISSQMPYHTHTGGATPSSATITAPVTIKAVASGGEPSPGGNQLGTDNSTNIYSGATTGLVPMAGNSLALTINQVSSSSTPSSITGGSQPHDNIQQYLAMNYIICIEGIFPSRN